MEVQETRTRKMSGETTSDWANRPFKHHRVSTCSLEREKLHEAQAIATECNEVRLFATNAMTKSSCKKTICLPFSLILFDNMRTYLFLS